MARTLRVAWFSPSRVSSPEESASLYCSRLLVPLLKKRFVIDWFADAPISEEGVLDASQVERCYREQDYDFFFYQIEDVACNLFVQKQLSRVPGVVLFHDIMFRPGGVRLADEEWTASVSRVLHFNNAPSRNLPHKRFAYGPALSAVTALFSSERNWDEWRRHFADIGTKESSIPPHREGYYLPYPTPPGLELLRQHDEREDPLIVACKGSPRIEHRSQYLLPALTRLSCPYRLLWMVPAGEREEAKKLASWAGVGGENLQILTPCDTGHWAETVSCADIAVHLQFSAFGDLGPYLPISMRAGVPCVVSDFGASEWLPEALVFKIRGGYREQQDLLALFETLYEKRGKRPEQVRAAMAYADELHSLERVAQELSNLFIEQGHDLRTFTQQWIAKHPGILG